MQPDGGEVRELTPELLRAMPPPSPDEAGDKDGRGRVLVIAGSRQVPGAAVLAATSALRAGAGKLQVAVGESLALHVGLALPEALVISLPETEAGGIEPRAAERIAEHLGRCDALLIGPGMMDEAAVTELTTRLLETAPAHGVVIDAAALSALGSCRSVLARYAGRLILTPHAGEMARLLGRTKDEVEADPCRAARDAAEVFGAVVVCKGRESWIASPGSESTVNRSGHVGLATSGSGDTLAGLVTGLLARGASPESALLHGVYVHAQAGARLGARYGGIGYLARELPREFPFVLGQLEGEGGAAG